MRWSWNRSKELTRNNDKVYLVVDGFGHNGRIFRETDVDTTVTDLMSEQYVAPVRVVAVNPSEHRVEDASEDTWQNAAFSADILKKQGIRSVYVVTQGWHMRRAMLAFRHTGLIATAVPASMEIPIDPIVWDFLPRASSWGWSYYALHEWIGCAWYAIR